MKRLMMCGAAVLLAAGARAGAETIMLPTYDGLRALVDDDLRREVRPGDHETKVPYWNRNATFFQYPPRMEFKSKNGAASYRYTVFDDLHNFFEVDAKKPELSLLDNWFDMPTGIVTVTCEALDAKGESIGVCGRKQFWKNARFKGEYPHPNVAYADAARRVFEYMLKNRNVTYLTDHGEPDRSYGLNAYETKMHGGNVQNMLEFARLCPERRDRALQIAKAEADYLLKIMQPADAPLAYFTLTYSAEPFPTEEGGAAFRGQSMNIYPANAMKFFIMLYEETKIEKYLTAAKQIASTFLKLQREDGTWYIRQYLKDGKPVIPNPMLPSPVIGPMLSLHRLTGDETYLKCADRATAWLERNSLKTYLWDGQFEDGLGASIPYDNLSKHMAAEAAFVEIERHPGDLSRRGMLRELLRWCEDQFVFWEKPGRPGPYDDPDWIFARYYIPAARTYPSSYEQYGCYTPIDASAAKMIRFYLAMYKEEGNILDLMKAKALGDSMLRELQHDGRIPTFWSSCASGGLDCDWMNCMGASAMALMRLSEYQDVCNELDVLARPAPIRPQLEFERDGKKFAPYWSGDVIDFTKTFPDGRNRHTAMPEYELTGAGTVTVPEDGDYVLELNADWRLWVKLDGREVYAMPDGLASHARHLQIANLKKGEHRLDFRFGSGSAGSSIFFRLTPAYVKTLAKPNAKAVVPSGI